MAIHMPPSDVELDVCYGGRKVGSKAIHDWVIKTSQLLTLCGHIHESVEVSGVWKAKLGQSIVIQPGQEFKTILVDISIDNDSILTNRIAM